LAEFSVTVRGTSLSISARAAYDFEREPAAVLGATAQWSEGRHGAPVEQPGYLSAGVVELCPQLRALGGGCHGPGGQPCEVGAVADHGVAGLAARGPVDHDVAADQQSRAGVRPPAIEPHEAFGRVVATVAEGAPPPGSVVVEVIADPSRNAERFDIERLCD
jgi:hypothetical protein